MVDFMEFVLRGIGEVAKTVLIRESCMYKFQGVNCYIALIECYIRSYPTSYSELLGSLDMFFFVPPIGL